MNLRNFQTMDPNLLLSIVNMKLRNDHSDLNDLTRYYEIDRVALCQTLAAIGYRYNADTNQFVAG